MATYYIDPVNGNDANDGGGWWKLAFASGTGAQPVAGETVTGAGGATAKIIKVTGTWATSGVLYLYNRNATAFADGEAISFSGGGACVNAQGTPFDSVVAAFKTIKKTFAAGDTINAAKSPETAAAGTVAAVLGSTSVDADSNSGQKVLNVTATSDFRVGNPVIIGAGTDRYERGQIASIQAGVSLTLAVNMTYTHTAVQGDTVTSPLTCIIDTTNDLTGVIAQYTIIRIGGDDTLYMVKGISSSAITLYRPYRGAAGSGKGITYFDSLPLSDSYDWQPTAMIGTVSNLIVLNGGINPVSNTQDGFTILYTTTSSARALGGTWTLANMSRVGFLNFPYCFDATLNDCTFSNVFNFKSTSFGGTKSWYRCTINGFVCENGSWLSVDLYDCTINDLETADVVQAGWESDSYVNIINSVVNRWRNAGYISKSSLRLWTCYYSNVTYNDPVFDELNTGATNIEITGTGAITSLHDLFIKNPIFGIGTEISLYSSCTLIGSLGIDNVNGAANDYRRYIGLNYAGKYSLLSRDDSVYHTEAPSGKISLFQSNAPTIIKHYIPCDAGVQKTISVYFRKNSSYGSLTRPTMRLRWMTGSAGALVSNVHDEVMADTDDTFLQSSYAVTPSVQGSITMELIFQSANAGAIAWYDDIGVA